MIVRVKQEYVAQKRRICLLPLHLVAADIPIAPAVHAAAVVHPNLAVVPAEPAVALAYAPKALLPAAPKMAHAPKIRENRLTPNFYIFTGLTQIARKSDIFHRESRYFSNLTP